MTDLTKSEVFAICRRLMNREYVHPENMRKLLLMGEKERAEKAEKAHEQT